MRKIPNTKVNVSAIDRNIQFNSAGETELKAGEGVPVTATGNPRTRMPWSMGTVAVVLVHNPA
jgi:hypothetical protein